MAASDLAWVFSGVPTGAVETVGVERYPSVRFVKLSGSDAVPSNGLQLFDGRLTFVVPEGDALGKGCGDGRLARSALLALADMATLTSGSLRNAVSEFVRRFGAIDPSIIALCDNWMNEYPFMALPDSVRSGLFAYGLPKDDSLRPAPLFLYAHEARNLQSTLQLYRALRDDDRDAVKHWVRIHPATSIQFRMAIGKNPILVHHKQAQIYWEYLDHLRRHRDDFWTKHWSAMGWDLLQDRIWPYTRSLVSLDIVADGPQVPDDQPLPRTPSGMFVEFMRYRILAKGIIGAIYTQLMQLVAEQRPVRLCQGCGKLFIPERNNQTFCSKRCGNAARGRRFRSRVSA